MPSPIIQSLWKGLKQAFSEDSNQHNNIIASGLSDMQPKDGYLDILQSYGLSVRDKEYWWVQYPKRACEEILKMQNSTNAKIMQVGNKLIWDETIRTNLGNWFRFTIEARDYPHRIPIAYLKEPYIQPDNDIHLLSGRQMCLMSTAQYSSRISILDLRNQAASWSFCLEVFSHTGKWPAAEH